MPKTFVLRISTGLLVVTIVLLSALLFRPRPAQARDQGSVVAQQITPIEVGDHTGVPLPSGWHVVGFSCFVDSGATHCFIAIAREGN